MYLRSKFFPKKYKFMYNYFAILQIKKDRPIDSQKNPIAISPWSYETLNGPKSLYAMGPLVGDNVVRVIPGGAIAIAGDIHKERNK